MVDNDVVRDGEQPRLWLLSPIAQGVDAAKRAKKCFAREILGDEVVPNSAEDKSEHNIHE